MTGREKWAKYLAGGEVGPMVCPLCDKWGAAEGYEWKGPDPEPFAGDESRGLFRGQIMMARTFGWDPLFYAAIKFQPEDMSIAPVAETSIKGNKTYTSATIRTPLGNLTQIEERNGVTQRCVKKYLENERDYEMMLWYTAEMLNFRRDAALEDGKKLREAVGDLGMIGTWVSPSVMLTDVQTLYYDMMDYPEAFEALRAERLKLLRLQLGVYREAGFDFMFYCLPGTDTISPGFYEEWIKAEVLENIRAWSAAGGFTLLHSCGHLKAMIEKGIHNEMLPEMMETLSVPPVGNIPSLAWARERLDPRIITKGNIPLDILLGGLADDVREAVRRVKRETAGYRHVIGLSDNILNGTPSRNLRAFVDEGYRA